jgi:hypothetical protein
MGSNPIARSKNPLRNQGIFCCLDLSPYHVDPAFGSHKYSSRRNCCKAQCCISGCVSICVASERDLIWGKW